MADRTRRTPKKDWKPAFLKALAETSMVKEACATVGIGRSTVYDARQADEAFALAWADVESETTDQLEAEAKRRALDGSDTLLIFLLKARRPDVYRENVKVEHSGKIRREVVLPTDSEWNQEVATVLLEAGALHTNGNGNGNGSHPHK